MNLENIAVGERPLLSVFSPAVSRGAANFQVFLSTYIDWMQESGRTHILVAAHDHCSLVEGARRLEKLGATKKEIPLNHFGQVTAEALEKELSPRSALLSLSWVSELTGVIQPIYDLATVCEEKGVRLHVDATGALGQIHFQFSDLGADFLTFEAGVLVAEGRTLSPLYFDEESPVASAKTEEEPGLFSLESLRLRDFFEERLTERAPDCQILFQNADRIASCSALAFPRVHGELLAATLSSQGIEATTGKGRLPKLLLACGVSPLVAYSAVSLNLKGRETEKEMIELCDTLLKSARAPKFPDQEEAARRGMHLFLGKAGSFEKGEHLTLYLLVDTSDGKIADCKWDCFGPSELSQATELATRKLIRRPYREAARLSASALSVSAFTNLVIDAAEEAADRAIEVLGSLREAPEKMVGVLETTEAALYPDWVTIPASEQRAIVEEVIASDVRPYIELDEGGIEILKIEQFQIQIRYAGACTSCYSATGATLEAINQILRQKIHPDLVVVPDLFNLAAGEGT